jgi:hypothetical protein
MDHGVIEQLDASGGSQVEDLSGTLSRRAGDSVTLAAYSLDDRA